MTDYIAQVSDKKEQHVLHFWFAKTSEAECQLGRRVTAGEVARYVGQSRSTAQKYMEKLVASKDLIKEKKTFKNGTKGYVYSIPTYQE